MCTGVLLQPSENLKDARVAAREARDPSAENFIQVLLMLSSGVVVQKPDVNLGRFGGILESAKTK